MQITRITRTPYTFTLPTSLGTPEAVSVAVLQKRHGPVGSGPNVTVWLPVDTYDPGTRTATFLLAGPDVDSSGAVVVSEGGGDLWAADITAPTINAARIERITVDGGTSTPTTTKVLTQALIGLDTDGTPFYDPAGIGSPTTVSLDIDATPYFTA